MVTHDCALIARMSLPSPPRPVTPPSNANRSERRRRTGKKVQLKLDNFLHPATPPPVDESELTGESRPPKWPQSPTAADGALPVECLEKPAKRRCKTLRLAKPLRHTRTAAEKITCLQYANNSWRAIPVAPVEHVPLFKVKYSHQRKWYTELVAD